jgi:hypothetical protein
MDAILHLLGFCADSHGHLDLMDILLTGTYSGMSVYMIYVYVKSLIIRG